MRKALRYVHRDFETTYYGMVGAHSIWLALTYSFCLARLRDAALEISCASGRRQSRLQDTLLVLLLRSVCVLKGINVFGSTCSVQETSAEGHNHLPRDRLQTQRIYKHAYFFSIKSTASICVNLIEDILQAIHFDLGNRKLSANE